MGLPFESQVRQLVFPGFRFGKDDPRDAERLAELGAGGFCLYGGGGPAEVAALVRRLQRRAAVPLLFCADYEDGTASQVAGGTLFPSNMGIAASGDAALAAEKARLTAREALAMGVRWVFAPVVDLATRPENPIVNVRAFSDDPRNTARFARAYLRGLKAGGALSCLKHFPGHGETEEDSHLVLPDLRVPYRRLLSRELLPYELAASAADSVMLAHVRAAALGDPPGLPATLSRRAVEGLLRRRLGFKGLAVSDALDMRAVADRFSEGRAALKALEAGEDVLLVPAEPRRLLEELPRLAAARPALRSRVGEAWARLRSAKRRCRLFEDGGPPTEPLRIVGCAAHRRAAERMAAAALAWAPGVSAPGLPRRLAYLEPEASGPRAWLGAELVRGLRASGREVAPWRPGAPARALVTALFVGPRAYTGRIRLKGAEVRAARRALASAPSAVTVAFGSPFAADDLPRGPVLLAFSPGRAAQAAAARVLAGLSRATGRLPARRAG